MQIGQIFLKFGGGFAKILIRKIEKKKRKKKEKENPWLPVATS
jgi:hypothetical protein